MMLNCCFGKLRDTRVPDGLGFLLIIIALIVVYTIAKVLQYVRLSKKQWDEVDKSKLKKWDDEEW